MPGSYKIESKLEGAVGKFCCSVSFNGQPAERYEVESLDSAEIAATLQKVADDHAALLQEKQDTVSAVEQITFDVGGKIVVTQ